MATDRSPLVLECSRCGRERVNATFEPGAVVKLGDCECGAPPHATRPVALLGVVRPLPFSDRDPGDEHTPDPVC